VIEGIKVIDKKRAARKGRPPMPWNSAQPRQPAKTMVGILTDRLPACAWLTASPQL